MGYPLHVSIVYVMWSVDHAMNCPTGEYPTICHISELRDFTAVVLSKACCEVNVDPMLQHLCNNNYNEDGTHLNVCILDL